ncbi:MAG: UDP-N-acetylmuramate dehydrogenase, partial [Anaerolineaceae bacterium]|nr:UDP-N-acetylmuramate dehydrogenase [Anaerolineaceae bacterium]
VFGKKVQTNMRVAKYTTARIGGPADYLLVVHSSQELEETVLKLWENEISFYILGGGSNILVSDSGLRGVVIINHAKAIDIKRHQTHFTIWAESGALMSSIARKAGDNALSGLEWATSLPGTLGGAVYGNAGAFGGDISGNLVLAEILHKERGKECWPCEWFNFEYRSSILKNAPEKPLILTALLNVFPGNPSEIQELMDTFHARRRNKQPPGACTGSMFKNPPGDHAGRLIEAAGLKGTCIGDAHISQKHANFFINKGNACSADYMQLIQMVKNSVCKKFGVELELEVELLGDWDKLD